MSAISQQGCLRAAAFAVAFGIFLVGWAMPVLGLILGTCLDDACFRAKDARLAEVMWTGIAFIIVGVGLEVWRRWFGALFFCVAPILLFALLLNWPR